MDVGGFGGAKDDWVMNTKKGRGLGERGIDKGVELRAVNQA